ncbi:MAG: sensor histidine kinase, partial [Bacteroidia bacterium]
ALCSLISILVVVLIYRYQIKKLRKRNEIEKKLILSQLSALKAQMNPHFMYNAINSIQALILEHDIKNSNLYLSKFSNLLRKILDASGKEFISLKEEIDILSLYLDLEKLRFGEDFNFTIEVDKQIDEYAIQIPAMLLQPFIENALKHGLLHKKGNKFLKIQFNFYNNHLQCVIEDNGVGRKRSEEIKQRFKKTHQSFATEATDKRVELFNKFTHGKYKIQVTDLYQNDVSTGTRVTIEIPLN